MNKIVSSLPFPEKELDPQNYTANLLALCSAHSLLSAERLADIRRQLDGAFKETAGQYTLRESSTLPISTAQRLYSSVLYQADVRLLSLHSASEAIEALRTVPFSVVLEQGKEMILRLYDQNIAVFRRAKEKELPFPVYEYRYIMDKAFGEYLLNYSARFDARNCCAVIDYPLLGRPAYTLISQGVMFIYEYYTGILFENKFCSLFPKTAVERLLTGYARIYGCKYTDLLFNIAEVVLNNYLVCRLCGKPFSELSLLRKDVDELTLRCAALSAEQLGEELKAGFLQHANRLNDPATTRYLSAYIPSFTQELYAAARHNTPDKLLVIDVP